MKPDEIIEELKRIVLEYLPTAEGETLVDQISKENVRYVLMELEEKRTKQLSKKDEEILAELSFFFA